MVLVLIVLLLVLALGGLPLTGLHSYGYAPSGLLTVLLVVLVVLALTGRL